MAGILGYTTHINRQQLIGGLIMSIKLQIPKEIYESDKACGEFLVDCNEQLAKIAAAEKAIKEAKEVATKVMLERLELTGMKNFAFDFGTFSKTTRVHVSFPTAEDGGKDAATEWLQECFERSIIDLADVLNVQQARVSAEPVLAIEQAVKEYNEKHALMDPNFVPIKDSPFNHYEQTTLSTPRKRKG